MDLTKKKKSLLEDIKKVAREMVTVKLSSTDYQRKGNYSVSSIKKIFGNWNNALKKVDLKPSKRMNISDAELLEEFKKGSQSIKNKIYYSGRVFK